MKKLTSIMTAVMSFAAMVLLYSCSQVQVCEYEGVLPAASCPGIEYVLKFETGGKEGSVYELTMTYLEAEHGQDVVFREKGSYSIVQEADRRICILKPSDGGTGQRFLYSEETLTMLDADGKVPDTELDYKLNLKK